MKLSKQLNNRMGLGLRLQTANRSEAKTKQNDWLTGLKAIGQAVTNFLIGNQELKVWQTHDRQGCTSWHAYDPATGESVIQGSEQEMLTWIEQHYYHDSDYAQRQYQNQLMFQR
ncbi:MAG TPA: hypothetical protein V6C65_02590 [Allocoleopsis sp.]